MDIKFGYTHKKSCALNSLFIAIALILLIGMSSSLFAMDKVGCGDDAKNREAVKVDAGAIKYDVKPAGQFPSAIK